MQACDAVIAELTDESCTRRSVRVRPPQVRFSLRRSAHRIKHGTKSILLFHLFRITQCFKDNVYCGWLTKM